jgi:type IV pilus assembly protein PilC
MGIKITKPDTKTIQKERELGFDINKLLQTEISLTGGFGDKAKEQFYNELHTLLSAGVDVRNSLEMMIESREKEKDLSLIIQLNKGLIQGDSLSTIMLQSGKFGTYECVSIQIGEESGRLHEILKELHHYYGKRLKLKRQLIAVLSYPLFVLVIAMGVIYFMLNQIVPMFSAVFKRFDGELPYLTQVVVNLSELIDKYMWLGIASILVMIIFIFTQKKKDWFRKWSALIQLKIPFIGKALHKVYLARFCQSMQLLIHAQTPLLKAVLLVKNMIGFYPIEEALDHMMGDIEKGQSLHASMKKFDIFDKKMIALIKAAEEVNQLDSMFQKLSKQYGDEVEHQTNVVGSILEPFIILFIALFVGIVLIAMYLPLFSLSTSIA